MSVMTPYPGDQWADPVPGIKRVEDCPQRHLHTRCPEGYLAWHAWAEHKSRRHYQVRCPGCGYLTIWKRKPKGAP